MNNPIAFYHFRAIHLKKKQWNLLEKCSWPFLGMMERNLKGKVLSEELLRQKRGDEPWMFKTGEGTKMVLWGRVTDESSSKSEGMWLDLCPVFNKQLLECYSQKSAVTQAMSLREHNE